MNTQLEEYIAKHKVCTELIFRDWQEFLEILFRNCGSF